MKAIMVMFDSLNRHMLPPYGCDWVHAPNFTRLAERTVTFENSYIGSMPCIPARREMHTGRYNFLHRSWGPIEPFDDSAPQMLRHFLLETDGGAPDIAVIDGESVRVLVHPRRPPNGVITPQLRNKARQRIAMRWSQRKTLC